MLVPPLPGSTTTVPEFGPQRAGGSGTVLNLKRGRTRINYPSVGPVRHERETIPCHGLIAPSRLAGRGRGGARRRASGRTASARNTAETALGSCGAARGGVGVRAGRLGLVANRDEQRVELVVGLLLDRRLGRAEPQVEGVHEGDQVAQRRSWRLCSAREVLCHRGGLEHLGQAEESLQVVVGLEPVGRRLAAGGRRPCLSGP